MPEDFIINYYILTKNIFVSLSDSINWLNVQRDGVLKTLRTCYEKNIDYFKISKEEELNLTKINKKNITC